MMRRLSAVVLVALPVVCAAAEAPDGPSDHGLDLARDLGRGRVAAVTDGDTVVLEDGRTVRLVGAQAPKLPLGRPGFRAWPLASEAKAALEALVLDREVALRAAEGALAEDRHGRVLAHVFDGDGRWIQGVLVEAGLARVYSFADNRARVAQLLALERAARVQGRGIWEHAYYAIRAPEETARDLDTFQIVEGEVLDAEVRKRRAFLNFGPDWRTDFTAYVPGEALRTFEDAGIALANLAGRRVRVRGWVGSYNGPEILLTHPEQLEVLSP